MGKMLKIERILFSQMICDTLWEVAIQALDENDTPTEYACEVCKCYGVFYPPRTDAPVYKVQGA